MKQNRLVSSATIFAALAASLTVANAAFALRSFQVGFAAPTIDGTANVPSPEEGAMILDASQVPPVFSGYNGTSWVTFAGTNSYKAPTVQRFTTAGACSYTLPSPAPLYIKVTCVGGGGGGGGGGSSQGNGGNAGNTTFGSLITCYGGSGGTEGTSGSGAPGGAGGSTSVSAGPVILASVPGEAGSNGFNATDKNPGRGGTSPFGGAGIGGVAAGAGATASANSGSGGGGAGGGATFLAGSGGAGGYVSVIISSPSSETCNVGSAGSAGAGTYGGGAGAVGYLVVEEFYQ